MAWWRRYAAQLVARKIAVFILTASKFPETEEKLDDFVGDRALRKSGWKISLTNKSESILPWFNSDQIRGIQIMNWQQIVTNQMMSMANCVCVYFTKVWQHSICCLQIRRSNKSQSLLRMHHHRLIKPLHSFDNTNCWVWYVISKKIQCPLFTKNNKGTCWWFWFG